MILDREDRRVRDGEPLECFSEHALRGRGLDDRDALGRELGRALDARGGRDEQAGAVDEGQVGEVNLRLARERARGRPALDVHASADHGRDAGVRGQLDPLDLELGKIQIALDARSDLPAEIDGVASRLAVRPEERERLRGLAIADGDGAGASDLEHRVGVRGRARRREDCKEESDGEQCPHVPAILPRSSPCPPSRRY